MQAKQPTKFSAVRHYVSGIFELFTREDAYLWCAAIAFKFMIAFVPLGVLLAGVFSFVLRRGQVIDTLSRFLESLLPAYESKTLVDTVLALSETGVALTAIGALGLAMAVFSLFTTLRVVVTRVFDQRSKSFLVGFRASFTMMLSGGFLFLLTFAGIFFINLVTGLSGQLINWIEVGRGLSLLLPLLITLVLFFQMYFMIPPKRPSWKSALIGAAVAAVLWEIAKNLFTWYATSFGQFDRYAGFADEGVRKFGELIGLVFALVFWAYYSGFVVIAGARIAALHDRWHSVTGLTSEPEPRSVALPTESVET